jgi:hypothetical protein
MKILQSFAPFAMRLPAQELPGGKVLPEVVLPKSHFGKNEVYANGPRKGQKPIPFVELTEDEVEAVERSPQIRAMFAQGQYRWVPKIPDKMKAESDIIAELRAENEALKAKLGAGGTA